MLENTPEHKCESDNQTGFTEPPDILFDWLKLICQRWPGRLVKGEFIPFCRKVMEMRPIWPERKYIIERNDRGKMCSNIQLHGEAGTIKSNDT